jgi:hypothetical protein
MILKEYPNLGLKSPGDEFSPEWAADSTDLMTQICNIRKDDIVQAKNLDNQYWAGRTVGRIPSSSADVISGDKIGDLSYDANYIYILVNNAGSGVWRRATLGAW